MSVDAQIAQLENQLATLKEQRAREMLLEDIWNELGPYTPHLSTNLRYRMQDYFNFDDSE